MENKFSLLFVACLIALALADPVPTPNLPLFTNLKEFSEESGREILLRNVSNSRGARIINGNQASTNQFPFFSKIVIYRGYMETWCGSSLITPTWVITAAHCMRE